MVCKRVDSEDNVAYSFNEIVAFYKGTYAFDDIVAYWHSLKGVKSKKNASREFNCEWDSRDETTNSKTGKSKKAKESRMPDPPVDSPGEWVKTEDFEDRQKQESQGAAHA